MCSKHAGVGRSVMEFYGAGTLAEANVRSWNLFSPKGRGIHYGRSCPRQWADCHRIGH
jgi:hypothetical protein